VNLLLTTARVQIFSDDQPLTNATGFFFERGERLFRITCRQSFLDYLHEHYPDRVEIELYIGEEHLSLSSCYSISL